MGEPLMMTNEGLVLIGQEFEDAAQVLTALSGLAEGQGLVDESYLPAILKREENFPTGLELPVNIAIPHIDTGVRRSFVSIATLKNPVSFLNMDHSGDTLMTQIVFMFGIMDPKDQLKILRLFARTFSQKEKIQSLVDAKSAAELVSTLNGLLENMLCVEEAPSAG